MLISELPPSPPVLAIPLDKHEAARLESQIIDLRIVTPRCPEPVAGEISVCATDPETYRARPLPDTYRITEGLPRAELEIAPGVSLNISLDSETMLGGYSSKRVMTGVKFKF